MKTWWRNRIKPFIFAKQHWINPVLLTLEINRESQVKYDVFWGEGKDIEEIFYNSRNELVSKLKF